MPLTSTYSSISVSQTDSNSPLDQVLMDALRQDVDVLYEWMGGPTYTPSTSHTHNGVNSAVVSLGSSAITTTMIANLAVTNGKLDAGAVTFGKINTSLQQTSGTPAGTVAITFTGGGQTLGWGVASAGSASPLDIVCTNNAGYVWGITLTGGDGGTTYYFQANYINSSPPWNLGDGDITLFIFVEIKPDGTVVRVDISDAPPWGYNGPTSVKPSRELADGRKFRRVRQLIAEHGTLAAARATGLTRTQIFDRMATDPWVEEEITHEIKNRDMPLIPHPFGTKQTPSNTIVLLDPVSPLMQRLATLHNEPALDERLSELLLTGIFNIGNTPLTRTAPPGVMVVSATFK